MAKLICIIGLPASGKTTLAKEYVKKGYTLIDDPYKFVVDSFFCRDGTIVDFDKKSDYVLTDWCLINKGVRERVKSLFTGYDIEEIYFENDVDKCKHNNQGRDRNINWESYHYEIPENIKPIEIKKK